MILSDVDIDRLLVDGGLVIRPITDYDVQLQPASFDVYLSNEFRQIDPDAVLDMETGIEPHQTSKIKADDKYVLHSGEFILGSTREYVEIPNGYICRVEGRSSIGRLAVDVHATAGYCDPGFKGNITLEITNKSDNPVVLRPGRRFAQLVFEATVTESSNHYGEKDDSKYQGQDEPTPSRIGKDTEVNDED